MDNIRKDMTSEVVGAVEIDESLLDDINGGDCHGDDGGGVTNPPTWPLTTQATSCVPPGTLCP